MINTIIPKSKENFQDSLIRNLVNQEYLKRDRWHPWLQALIPPNMPYFDPEDPETSYIWTPTLYRETNFKKARYVLLVCWKAESDRRQLIRLYKRRGWEKGENPLYIYDYEKERWLTSEEVKFFIVVELKPRLWKVLGTCRLDGKEALKIRRYRFNSACYYPGSFLTNLDGHHEKTDNEIAAKRIDPNVKEVIGEEWFRATDDRPYNIVPKTRKAHYKEHLKMGDTGFKNYIGDKAIPM